MYTINGLRKCRNIRKSDFDDKQIKRFLSKRKKKGNCIIWTGGTDKDSYGKFAATVKGKVRHLRAHRMAFAVEHGFTPSNRLVLHTCDNPICVNPKHLYLGGMKENVRDAIERGRWPDKKGILNPRSKLTESQIIEIRNRYSGGHELQREIALDYGVCQETISLIINRRIYSNVD